MRRLILIFVIVVIIGAIFVFEIKRQDIAPVEFASQEPESLKARDKAKEYMQAPEILSPAGFINTEELKIADLIGKRVILIDFWTYSCINCQRTLPYLTAWYSKYRDQGLEIIGVHTPEFEFEEKYDNVQKAVNNFNIEYPVVLDNDYATWRNYRNRYWPRKYLIDIDGFIVYDHIGEGAYGETEKKIQALLEERKRALAESGEVAKSIVNPVNAETGSADTPEIYFGADRNEYLANGVVGKTGAQSLDAPEAIEPNRLYLVGEWDIQGESAKNLAPAKVILKYKASKIFMVARSDNGVGIEVKLDNQVVGQAGGSDLVNGQGRVKEDRLYRLIEDPRGYGEHTLEIIIEAPGLEIFTFTFG